MTDTINVSFTCPCGQKLIWPDDATDGTPIVCSACGGQAGTFADLKAKAREKVAAEVKEKFRAAFKGLKGWKVS